jgi:hypothetical protein
MAAGSRPVSTSFSEEKEAKRLYDSGLRAADTPTPEGDFTALPKQEIGL